MAFGGVGGGATGGSVGGLMSAMMLVIVIRGPTTGLVRVADYVVRAADVFGGFSSQKRRVGKVGDARNILKHKSG